MTIEELHDCLMLKSRIAFEQDKEAEEKGDHDDAMYSRGMYVAYNNVLYLLGESYDNIVKSREKESEK